MRIVQWIHVYCFPSFTIINIIISILSYLLLPLFLSLNHLKMSSSASRLNTLFNMFILRTRDPLYNQST